MTKAPDTQTDAARNLFPARPLIGVLGGMSRAGMKSRNDDAIAGRIPDSLYEMHTKGIVACIADGISTGANSDLAAQTSVTQFTQDYYDAPESWPVQDCAGRLLAALNAWFHGQNRTGMPHSVGQVTTFTALIARSTTAHVVHIGDTRCLRLRGDALSQMTEDHNASFMGQGQALTRALGVEAHIRVDYIHDAIEEGDLYLLLSDGVHQVLPSAVLRQLLTGMPRRTRQDLEATSHRICDAALAAGSDDNISCLLLNILQLPSETLTEAHDRLTERTIPPVLKPGNRIDGYLVEQILHSSTRSHVYLVRKPGEAGRWVLKAPSPNFSEDMHYLEAFVLEQWVGRRIDNPQVMKILPGDRSRFLYYIAEWVQGETLRSWMERNPRPSLDTVIEVLASLISAVRIFHRLGMVHRDLKPENVILDDTGRARIIDFGSVQVKGFVNIGAGRGGDGPEGSLDYISPEVLTGRGATNLSDLFSIAAIAYEMLTGSVPFDLSGRAKLPSGPSDWAFRSIRDTRSDLGAAPDAVLQRCLSFDPADRQPAMSEFLGDLRESRNSLPKPDRFVPLLQRGSRAFWRTLAVCATLAALVMLAVLVLGGITAG